MLQRDSGLDQGRGRIEARFEDGALVVVAPALVADAHAPEIHDGVGRFEHLTVDFMARRVPLRLIDAGSRTSHARA